MPWSAGTFSRTDGTRNGSTVWNQAKSAAVKINAADHDTHDQDLATGINACLAKDGSNAATADLDLDSHKLTNVTDPTSAQDAATKAYVDGAVGDLSGVTDASAARTALGLGTAAVKDTGTSGATVPLLNASNTWSADQTIQSADAGASTAPTLVLDRNSASPAANDQLGGISFNGRDSGGNLVNYGAVTGLIVDPTDGSEDGRVDIWTSVGGTLSSRAFVQQGLFMQGATGGDKGTGTINGTTLYQNGTKVDALGGMAKAWLKFNGGAAGPITPDTSFGISGTVTKNNTGDYTITLSTAFASANYVAFAWGQRSTASDPILITITSQLAGSLRIVTRNGAGAGEDYPIVHVIFFGNQ